MTVLRSLARACSVIALGAGLAAQQSPEGTPTPADAAPSEAAVDALGDPLPDHALARLGSLRLRHADEVFALRFDAATRSLESSAHRDVDRRWSVDDGRVLPLVERAQTGPTELERQRQDPEVRVQAAPDERAWLSWTARPGSLRLHLPGREPAPIDVGGRFTVEAAFTDDAAAVVLAGDRVTSRSDFGTWLVRVDVATGAPAWEVELPGVTISHLLVLPAHGAHEASVVLACRDGQLARRRLADGGDLGLWRAHSGTQDALARGPSGTWLSAADGQVVLWALPEAGDVSPSRGVSERWRAAAHLGVIGALAVSPELGLVASGGRDRRVRLWSLADGAPRVDPPTHATRLTSALAARDGRLAVTADWTGRLGLWRSGGVQRGWIDAHEGRVTGAALLDDARLLLTAGQDGDLALWSTAERAPVGERQPTGAAVIALAATPDGRHIASSGGDGLVRLWSLVPGSDEEPPSLLPQGGLSARARATFALAYLPDGAALALGTSQVRLIDAATGDLRWEADVGAPVASIAVAHDGARLAAALASRAVVVLDANDGRALWRWEGHPGRVTAVALAPDGEHVAAAGGDANVRIADMTAGGDVRVLTGHLEEVAALRWGADGVLVSASADGTALLWRP